MVLRKWSSSHYFSSLINKGLGWKGWLSGWSFSFYFFLLQWDNYCQGQLVFPNPLIKFHVVYSIRYCWASFKHKFICQLNNSIKKRPWQCCLLASVSILFFPFLDLKSLEIKIKNLKYFCTLYILRYILLIRYKLKAAGLK